jgi:hypothetical protein
VRYYNRYALTRFSFESMPMVSYMSANGVVAAGIPTNNWSFGDATLITVRTVPSLYVVGGFTAQSVGGPFGMNSSEFGFRLKPWTAPRFSPFADVRESWAYTTGVALPSSAVPISVLYRDFYNSHSMGSGNGTSFGLGMETRITARYSLTTVLSSTHYSMNGRDLSTARRWDYTADATRLMVGLRYNHGHWFDAP